MGEPRVLTQKLTPASRTAESQGSPSPSLPYSAPSARWESSYHGLYVAFSEGVIQRFPTYQSYFVRKLKLCQYSSISTSLPMKSSCSNAVTVLRVLHALYIYTSGHYSGQCTRLSQSSFRFFPVVLLPCRRWGRRLKSKQWRHVGMRGYKGGEGAKQEGGGR